MLELFVRLVASLAVVIGLLLIIAKVTSRRFSASGGSLVQVVQRQSLSRTSSVAVVTVGDRVLVLGTTENQVNLIAELDPDELEVIGDARPPVRLALPAPAAVAGTAAQLALPTGSRTAGAHTARSVREARPGRRRAKARRSQRAAAAVQTQDAEPLVRVGGARKAPRGAGVSPGHRAAGTRRRTDVAPPTAGSSALAGSVLSTQTWKQAFAAARSSQEAV